MNTLDAYSIPEIYKLVDELGYPKFRAKQLVAWVYNNAAISYSAMGNLPKAFKEDLAKTAPFSAPKVVNKQVSIDGTRKYLLELRDGLTVETVGIPSKEVNKDGSPKRLTVCFSTQVGCPMACAFCATGKEGFARNLLPGEMVQQVLTVQRDFDMRVTNVVGMGQGEPFLNFDNVIKALRIMNADDGLGIGARHITLSTCGIVKGINEFAKIPEQFTLAISLHSAIQETRDELMPVCAKLPLPMLKKALQSYIKTSNRRITFEYLLINGKTDTNAQIDALIEYCKGMLVHINFLNVNAIEGSPFRPTAKRRQADILKKMEDAGIEATIRDSRGADIDGACGQLKTKFQK